MLAKVHPKGAIGTEPIAGYSGKRLNMQDSFWFIKKCDLFSRMNQEDLQWLEGKSRTRKLKRGEPVYLPSQQSDGVVLVAEGRVKICHITPEGKQSILNFIDPNEIFGELSLFDEAQREEYAEAAEATTLILIPRDAMRAVVQKYPQIVYGVTKLIGLRRQRIERRLRNLLFRSNRDRVIHLLLELVEKYGRQGEIGIELNIRLSHQEMANVIGSTRETVTVVLGHLQNEGLIKIARRRITICNLEKLAGEVKERPPILRTASPRQPQILRKMVPAPTQHP